VLGNLVDDWRRFGRVLRCANAVLELDVAGNYVTPTNGSLEGAGDSPCARVAEARVGRTPRSGSGNYNI
jgi:hypothetical protein